MPSLPSGIPGLGSASHLQLPGPPGLSNAAAAAAAAGLPPGMLNYTSVLSSLASQYAPGIKEEGNSSMSKENASSPRANNNDLSSATKNSSSRSSTNGKSSKHHRPSSTSSNISKPPKPSATESDGERSESDLVIDTSVGGNQKHTNGGSSNAGSGLLLPNGIKSEFADNLTGSGGGGGGNETMSATPPVLASNGGGSSSRSRRDRSPMSDKDSSQRNSSSSAIKKERNTPQPNKALTPITGGQSNIGSSQMQQGGPLGLPPGLAGRLPPSAAFGYISNYLNGLIISFLF
jgi:hypothetical protein